MGSNSLPRDRTQGPCIGSVVLATGPPGKSLLGLFKTPSNFIPTLPKASSIHPNIQNTPTCSLPTPFLPTACPSTQPTWSPNPGQALTLLYGISLLQMHVPVSLSSSPSSAKSLPEGPPRGFCHILSVSFLLGGIGLSRDRRSGLNKISGSRALLPDRPSQSLVLTRNGGLLCRCWQQTGQALTICPVRPPCETRLGWKPHTPS